MNSLKRIVTTAMICMISAICLTGCMRFNTTVTVKSNGKLDVSMLYAMVDMSDYGFDEDSITGSQLQEFIDQGWEAEEYNQDGFKGYVLSRKDITPDELGSSMEYTQTELSGESSSLNFTKQGLKYTLDWQVFDRDQGEQISAYKNYFTMSGGYMKININLPVKPSASNATSVSDDGKSLEWDLLNLGPDQSIHLEFVLINIWFIVGLCVFALVIVVAIVVAIVLSSKKRKAAQMLPGGYYQPPQYGQQYQQPQYGQEQYPQPQYGQSQYGQVQYQPPQNPQPQYQQAQYQQSGAKPLVQNPQQEELQAQNQPPQYGQAQYQQPQYQQSGAKPLTHTPQQDAQQPQYQQSNAQPMAQAPQQDALHTPMMENAVTEQAATANLVADELAKLKKLLDDGVITRDEFDAQKEKLLSR